MVVRKEICITTFVEYNCIYFLITRKQFLFLWMHAFCSEIYKNLIEQGLYVCTCMYNNTICIHAGIQKQEVTFEFKIHLWPSQTCHDFLVSSQEVTVNTLFYDKLLIYLSHHFIWLVHACMHLEITYIMSFTICLSECFKPYKGIAEQSIQLRVSY